MKEQLKDELIKAQREYIQFLAYEIDKRAVYLMTHGQGFSNEVIRAGGEHRAKISSLELEISQIN